MSRSGKILGVTTSPAIITGSSQNREDFAARLF